MSNTLKFNQPIKVRSYTQAQIDTPGFTVEDGLIIFNSTTSTFNMYQNGSWRQVDAAGLDGHLDGGASKHDASEIDFEETSAAPNVSPGSVETAISDLGSAIGNRSAYSSTNVIANNDDVATALGKLDAASTDDQTAAEVTYTPTTGTDWVDPDPTSVQEGLDDLAARVTTNDAKVSADGSVTSHSDVTDAGSGAIITSAERSKLAGIEAGATADQTGAEIKSLYEAELNTNAFTDAEQTKLAGIEAGATADQSATEVPYTPTTGANWTDPDPADVGDALDDLATRVILNDAKVSADGSVTSHSDVTDAGSGAIITSAERSKLAGIEPLADVTDATNVAAAGAVMESDTTTALMSFVIDEDDMISNLDTKIPTQQSVKAYVDTTVSSATSYKGGYDAATDTPSLDSAPNVGINTGDQYTVTVAGTFYTTEVEIGDVLIAEVNDPTQESDWTIVNKNLDATSIKAQYESNADTNAFTDAEQTKLAGIEAGATADQTGAEIKAAYEAELNTNAFTDAEQTKLGFITVTQAVDLDSVESLANSALQSVSDDTAPSLGGDLTLGANTLIHDTDGVKRGPTAFDFLEEEYVHAITLTASQTNTPAAALQFAFASFEGMMVDYKIKEATSNRVRIGQLLVACDGTSTSITDTFTETGDAGVTWSAAINGANVEVRYTTTANDKTMRCDLKRIKA